MMKVLPVANYIWIVTNELKIKFMEDAVRAQHQPKIDLLKNGNRHHKSITDYNKNDGR